MPQFIRHTPSSASLKENVNYVGIDTLDEQTRARASRKGFTFNLMVVGRSGLGKSTLVNTLFKSSISQHGSEPDDIIPPTTKMRTVSSPLTEGKTKLTLTVIDTPGFGDNINNTDCWVPVVEYIENQYRQYLDEEEKPDRSKHIPDTRVHCCIYFISPTGHSLSALDVEVLQKLEKIVSIVPVIAKADSLTLEERQEFRENIKKDLKEYGIRLYPIPELEDPEDASTNSIFREYIPFAIVGSSIWHPVAGRKVLGRRTAWGLTEVENKNHNDFFYLRDMLIRNNMKDLIDITASHFYENFRRKEKEIPEHQHSEL